MEANCSSCIQDVGSFNPWTKGSGYSGASSLETAAPSGQKVKDQNDQRDNQENVYQTPGNVEAKAQKPKHEDDDKDCPEHIEPLHAA